VIYAPEAPRHAGAAWARKRDLFLWWLRLQLGIPPHRPETGK